MSSESNAQQLHDPCDGNTSAFSGVVAAGSGEESFHSNSQSAMLKVRSEDLSQLSQSADESKIIVHNSGWTEEEDEASALAALARGNNKGSSDSSSLLLPPRKAVWQPHWFVELLLFLVLGASGWWSSNIINAEQPVFVHRAPESDKLSNLISVSLQIGNIFPIAYKLFTGCRPDKSTESLLPYTIFTTLLIGCVSLFVCAFFWDATFSIVHHSHSVILLVCSFLSGGVGALSNVTFWALTSHFETRCIKALSTGMTFGGLIATGLALAQNAGRNPRFSVMTFMLIAGAIQVLVVGAFVPIMRLRRSHQQQQHAAASAATSATLGTGDKGKAPGSASPARPKRYSIAKGATRNYILRDGDEQGEEEGRTAMGASSDEADPRQPLLPPASKSPSKAQLQGGGDTGPARYGSVNDSGIDESPPSSPYPYASLEREPTAWDRVFSATNSLLYMSFLLYAMTYTIPSLMPFLADAYKANESLDSSIYLWMLVLQNVGDVVGRLATALPWQPQLRHLSALFAICTAFFALFLLATLQRDHVLHALPGKSGYVLAVACLVYYFCRGYLITSMYVFAKTHMPPKQAEGLSANLGFLGQIGALVANIIMFVIVNICGLLGD